MRRRNFMKKLASLAAAGCAPEVASAARPRGPVMVAPRVAPRAAGFLG